MAETQEPSLGYYGEFWLYNGTTLYELREVREFDVPSPGAREQVDATHLKSPNWRREFLSGFFEDTEFEVVLNSRPLSDTDVLLADALADSDVRAFKAVLPENGVPTSKIEGTCVCTGYDRGRVTPDGLMEATATFSVRTISAIAAGT
jgi:hypothetical protein